ncbi:hypothetical protein AB7D55_001313 [Vibrio mimicus]
MENQNDIPFIIKDKNGHTVPTSGFEDKHFVGLSHGSYSVNFISTDFGLFISHRDKEKEINSLSQPKMKHSILKYTPQEYLYLYR